MCSLYLENRFRSIAHWGDDENFFQYEFSYPFRNANERHHVFTLSATGCGGHAALASYKVKIQTAADHTVDLRWKASTTTDVAGYNIYRGPDGKSWTRINASLAASTVYTDSTIADRSTYYYSATAVDIKGMESKKSNIAKSVIP